MYKSCFLLLMCTFAHGNVLDMLKGMATHSKFANLLEKTDGIHKYYMDGYVTIFAPSNAALDKFKGELNKAFILNHIASAFPRASLQTVNAALGDSDLEQRLTSLLQGHPPLWIRKLKDNNMYVNNAKISMVLPTTTKNGNKQFLYPIEDVLEPLIPIIENNVSEYVDIKAGDILLSKDKYKLGENKVQRFAEQVSNLGQSKFPEYFAYGKSTFFIPVDQSFEELDKGLVDEVVVRAHIAPGNLLFTNPVQRKDKEPELYHTLQYKQSSMEVKVVVSLFEDEDGKVKVQSQTMTGNRNHLRGKVVANIIKANIPVQNGVVHLIDQPLVILAKSVWEMLDPTKPENKRFSKFANMVLENPDLLKKMQDTKSIESDDQKNGATIFVPTNSAFEELSSSGRMDHLTSEVLGLHFLDYSIESTDIRISHPQTSFKMFGTKVGFPDDSKNMVWMWNSTNGEIQLDGMGVQATIVDSDIRATNGIIHQIDKVLGVPLTTIYHKLQSDPMLRLSFKLGEQERYNTKFEREDSSFTFLVPTNEAWQTLKGKYATAFKVLFQGQFFYQSNNILDRHLKIGKAMNLTELLEAGKLETLRGAPLQIEAGTFEGEDVVYVKHEDIVAKIIRSNLKCSNGYIHIIDNVIMKRRDVTLSGKESLMPTLLVATLVPLLLTFIQH